MLDDSGNNQFVRDMEKSGGSVFVWVGGDSGCPGTTFTFPQDESEVWINDKGCLNDAGE
jgi:hypothetical protein